MMYDKWLRKVLNLSGSSIYKYSHTVNTISRETVERDIIKKRLKNNHIKSN